MHSWGGVQDPPLVVVIGLNDLVTLEQTNSPCNIMTRKHSVHLSICPVGWVEHFQTRINTPFQLVVAVNAIVPPLPLVAGAGGAGIVGVTGV